MLTKEKLKEIVSRPEYDFLRTNPRLKDKILFLTVGGSYAYGTNVEGSDIEAYYLDCLKYDFDQEEREVELSFKEYNDEKYVICENYREIDLALGK